MPTENPYRLPRDVEPLRYDLTLTPDLDNASFTGEERVTLTIKSPVESVKLNAAELEILSAELVKDDGDRITASVTLDEEAEVATLNLPRAVEPGEWMLHATFKGVLNDKLRGFYRSTFVDESGAERVIATTQFEATEARRAFPCWDEPDFKAIFGVTLIIDEAFEGFSNAALEDDTDLGNGKRQLKFADTMKMSTYLVAFVVGPLVATEPVDVDGVPLRVACVPGKEKLTPFALEVGAAALRFFSKYFRIPYPGGKLDMIALPDFAFGAMENLGCVTFRETALLVDTKGASRHDVERVADVVGHEVAHMWFGDLVTMKWWNGLWLNEAFANFMEISFVDQFRPEWQRWVSAGLMRSMAMTVDSLNSTRPIEFEVIRPEEAQGMFDVLTYDKGGAVLRMLEQHLGADKYADGIAHYLKKHSYGNAETTDLWDALEHTSGEPVRALMDTWIFQGGHPIVEVDTGSSNQQLMLKQRAFKYIDQGDKQQWHIPIGIRYSVDGTVKTHKLLLTDEQTVIELDGEPEWVVVNAHSHGFFRVSYGAELFAALRSNVSELEPLERFSLMTDTWAACLAGRVQLSDVLDLIKELRTDTDPNVWGAMIAPVRLVDKLVDDATRPGFEAFVREVASTAFSSLGWDRTEGESELVTTLRGVVIGALGGLGQDKAVLEEAEQKYVAYLADPDSLDPDLVEPIETILATTNDPAHYDRIYARFADESQTPQIRINAIQTLACFTEPSLVDRTLELIDSGKVRTQDAPYTLRVMLTRRGNGDKVWNWCEAKWDVLMSRFPDNSIVRMLDGVTAQTDPALLAQAKTFMAAHPVPQAQKTVDQIVERCDVNIGFTERNASVVPSLFS